MDDYARLWCLRREIQRKRLGGVPGILIRLSLDSPKSIRSRYAQTSSVTLKSRGERRAVTLEKDSLVGEHLRSP